MIRCTQRKLSCPFILGLSILLLYAAYKTWFGSLKTNDRDESVNVAAARSHVLSSKFNISNVQNSKGFNFFGNSIQSERRRLIKEFCKQTGQTTQRDFDDDLRHLAVNLSSKIIYCVTPKCASRQMRQMLFPFRVQGERGVPKIWQFPKHEQDIMVETYFKLTFVREPFERILSAYKDKFVYPRNRPLLERHGGRILKNFRLNATQRALKEINDITFREFIEYLVTKGSNRSTSVMDWHWDNYVNICGMCSIEYDFIGHYETMEQDLADFITAAGLSAEDARRLAAYRHTPSSTSSSLLKYYSQIPLEWINILGQIYKANFEMFGYNFPGPLKSLYEN